MKILPLLALFLLPLPVAAQAWYPVPPVAHPSSTSIGLPPMTTYRTGHNSSWSIPKVTPSTGTTPIPAPVNPNILQVAEKSTPQTLTATDTSTTPPTVTSIIVPAVIPLPPLVGTYTCTVVFTKDWNFTIPDPNSCYLVQP